MRSGAPSLRTAGPHTEVTPAHELRGTQVVHDVDAILFRDELMRPANRNGLSTGFFILVRGSGSSPEVRPPLASAQSHPSQQPQR